MNDVNPYLARAKKGRNDSSSLGGQQYHYVVDLTGASANVAIAAAQRGCRWVECDVSGIIKVGYMGDGGTEMVETKSLQAGEKWLVIDVATVYYQYGTSPAACDSQVYTNTGDLVVGIKLKY